MSNLVAKWHHPAEVGRAELDPVELLSWARDGLIEIPELKDALRLVDLALGEVSAWFATELSTEAVRRPCSRSETALPAR